MKTGVYREEVTDEGPLQRGIQRRDHLQFKNRFRPGENQPTDLLEEFDSEETIDAIRQVLQDEGHHVITLGGAPGSSTG